MASFILYAITLALHILHSYVSLIRSVDEDEELFESDDELEV